MALTCKQLENESCSKTLILIHFQIGLRSILCNSRYKMSPLPFSIPVFIAKNGNFRNRKQKSYFLIFSAGLETSFRKFFKFQVVKPLDVKTKFYNAETDEVYLEAQIQNITAGPICLEKVDLESTEQYTVTSLNTLPNGESVFCSKNMLQPNNSCQFLYCIKPIAEIANDPKALKDANNIGKLDIVWRSNLGERGRLQTSQLQRSVS